LPLQYGRKPRDFTRPALTLEHYLTAGGLPPAPAGDVDRCALVPKWPMYGNDQWGDCVWAMIGHMIQSWSAYAGTEVSVPKASLLKGYSDVTGFDPNAGPPGNNPTDQGTNIQDALAYWKFTGIKDSTGTYHKIAGYAAFGDCHNIVLTKQVVSTFGSVALGVNFPVSGMDQFNAGEPWTYVPGSPIDGGHAYPRVKVSGGGLDVYTDITWAKAQRESLRFNLNYTEEAWAVVSQDWIDANGVDITGLNLTQLLADMAFV
jgi:hypothetical protein